MPRTALAIDFTISFYIVGRRRAGRIVKLDPALPALEIIGFISIIRVFDVKLIRSAYGASQSGHLLFTMYDGTAVSKNAVPSFL